MVVVLMFQEQADTFVWLKKEAVRIVKENGRKNSPKMHRTKRSSSPESESDTVRRSKRLKECPPINFRELVIEDEFSDAGEGDGDGDDGDYAELVSDEPVSEEPVSEEPVSEPGLSGMEFLLGDLFCSPPRSRLSSVEESVDVEMSVFRADKGASLGVEPLHWWKVKAVQFPLLASVARAYLAAPAVAGSAALDFVREGPGTTSRKRSNIPPESLDAILFLHHNRISSTESGPASMRE